MDPLLLQIVARLDSNQREFDLLKEDIFAYIHSTAVRAAPLIDTPPVASSTIDQATATDSLPVADQLDQNQLTVPTNGAGIGDVSNSVSTNGSLDQNAEMHATVAGEFNDQAIREHPEQQLADLMNEPSTSTGLKRKLPSAQESAASAAGGVDASNSGSDNGSLHQNTEMYATVAGESNDQAIREHPEQQLADLMNEPSTSSGLKRKLPSAQESAASAAGGVDASNSGSDNSSLDQNTEMSATEQVAGESNDKTIGEQQPEQQQTDLMNEPSTSTGLKRKLPSAQESAASAAAGGGGVKKPTLKTSGKSKSKPKFTCSTVGCGRSFDYYNYLADHERIHLDLNPFVCTWPNCGQAARTIGNTRRHIREMHFKLPRSVQDERNPDEYIRVEADQLNRHQS